MSGTPVELTEGAAFTGSGRTITDAEVALLPAIMGAVSPLFHDEVAARDSRLGRRVLYGPALLGIAIASTEPILHDVALGLVALTDVRFRRPVGVGDTVTATITVREVKPRPEKAGDFVVLRDEVHNQDGELVLEFQRTVMVRRAGG